MTLAINGLLAINESMLAVSRSPAASIAAKATVVAALGLTGAWVARRSRAALRHALLAAAFGVLLLLPIASVLAPPLRIAIKAATGSGPRRAQPEPPRRSRPLWPSREGGSPRPHRQGSPCPLYCLPRGSPD